MQKLIVLYLMFISFFVMGQDKKSYQLFDKNGKKTSYKKLVNSSLKKDVVKF